MSYDFEFSSAYKQLIPSQKVFVDGYVADLENKAVKTGEKLKNLLMLPVNDDLPEVALNMLSMSLVRAAIAERVEQLSEEMELSVHKTLKELRSLAYSNIGHYMVADPEDSMPLFDLRNCTPEEFAAIQSIEIEENARGGRKFKFKLHDKVSSLHKLMQYQGLLDDEHWKAERAAELNSNKLTKDMSNEAIADEYSKLINS